MWRIAEGRTGICLPRTLLTNKKPRLGLLRAAKPASSSNVKSVSQADTSNLPVGRLIACSMHRFLPPSRGITADLASPCGSWGMERLRQGADASPASDPERFVRLHY